jgi:hypothetical protein
MYTYLRECQYIFYGRNSDRFDLFKFLYVVELAIMYPMWIAFYSMCASSDIHLVSSVAESGVILVGMLWTSKAIIVVTEVKSVLSVIQGKMSLVVMRKFVIFGAMFLEVVVTVLSVVGLSMFPGVYSFYIFGVFASQIVWTGIWVGRLFQVWRHISQASMVDYKHLREMHEEPTEIQMLDGREETV